MAVSSLTSSSQFLQQSMAVQGRYSLPENRARDLDEPSTSIIVLAKIIKLFCTAITAAGTLAGTYAGAHGAIIALKALSLSVSAGPVVAVALAVGLLSYVTIINVGTIITKQV